jgi:hypothetical protein
MNKREWKKIIKEARDHYIAKYEEALEYVLANPYQDDCRYVGVCGVCSSLYYASLNIETRDTSEWLALSEVFEEKYRKGAPFRDRGYWLGTTRVESKGTGYDNAKAAHKRRLRYFDKFEKEVLESGEYKQWIRVKL